MKAGIDLGNSRLKLAAFDPQGNPTMLPNDQGELWTPSVVFFDGDQEVVGAEAVHAGLLDSERCVSNWKRHMGTEAVLCTKPDGTECKAADIARILLEYAADQFQRRTGDVLSKAAVSVPANYTDAQKRATLDAAAAAGIDVVVTPHEPTAAGFGNSVQKRGDGLVVLFDLGGGTFDVSVVKVTGNTVEVIATNGEPALGGQDFNAIIQDLVLDRFEAEHGSRPTQDAHPLVFQELHNRVEQAKITLTARESAQVLLSIDGTVFKTTVSRDEFRTATEDIVTKAMDCAERTLKEADVCPSDVRELIPVGGASQMPCFLEAIEKRFGRKPTQHAEPNFAVALGTLVVGRITEEREGNSVSVGGRKLPPLEYRVRDVTAHAVGVCTVTETRDQVNTVILAKGKPAKAQII